MAGSIGRCRPWAAVLWVLGSACAQQVEVAARDLGQQGESCEARSDCAAELVCLDLICQTSQGAAAADGGAGVPSAAAGTSRGGVGESCGRRADCHGALACLRFVCTLQGGDGGVDALLAGPRRGGHGESCAASNDCGPGMGCVDRACLARSLTTAAVDKECFRVECVQPDDCCKDFVPDDASLCQGLQAGCQAGSRADCNLAASLCDCNQVCEDSVCVARVECQSDGDCGGSGVLRCIAGRCGQCGTDADCGELASCVSGLCRGGCTRDEQCPLFSRCKTQRCEQVGCQSDRECFFATDNPLSRCVDGDCATPCKTDAECASELSACVDGLCAFVGCESDEECRAALMLADQPSSAPHRAVCLAP